MQDQPLSGGCQCGRVRYTITASTHAPDEPEGFRGVHICHCRMCQRATGGVFGVWLPVEARNLSFTGEPKAYRSSPFLERLFCPDCGSPIGSRYVEGLKDWPFSHLRGILVGSLDDPELVRPAFHFGIESRVSWDDIAAELPKKRTDELEGFEALWQRAAAQFGL